MATTNDKRHREVPRVRDMPAPRKSEGAAGGLAQRIFAWPYRGLLAFLLWTGVSPWQLTLLVARVQRRLRRAHPRRRMGLGGRVALHRRRDSATSWTARSRGTAVEVRRSGAFMDSVLDRVADMILFGCLFWWLPRPGEEFGRGARARSRSWCRSR